MISSTRKMNKYEQVQEHATGDEHAQTQASIAGPIIEQQGIQVRNSAVDVDYTQETEEEI